MTFKIIIVGSGVAGLTAATVLRHKIDANITIIERSDSMRAAGGQGISLGPNCVQILDSLGFDRERASVLIGDSIKAYNAQTGAVEKTIPMNAAEKYGADCLMCLRSDLRAEILRLATEGSGEKTRLLTSTNVTDVDVESGDVFIEGGEKMTADLVIIAAGIGTTLGNKIVTNAEYKSNVTGQSIIRFLLSAENAEREVGFLPEWWDPAIWAHLSYTWADDGTNRAIITYPCHNFQYLNASLAFPNEYLEESAAESWHQEGDVTPAHEIFHDFPKSFTRFIKYAEQVRIWKLRDHDPLPNYVRGRAVLIGDSAHAMAPFQGQGASQAVEDGEGFRLFLEPGISREDVPNILKRWESVRQPRAVRVQLSTRQASQKLNQAQSAETQSYNWTYEGIFKELSKIEK